MSDPNTRRIAKNTGLLYMRMLVMMVIGFITTRVMLKALGVDNYGINNVVGGLVSMFSMLSASLSGAVSRFFTFGLGKGDMKHLRVVFSTSINIHIVRKVLFTGTPCQIAGLKRFLRKDYDNLLTADVICHGVPSPLVWQKYLDKLRAKGEITEISFRDKTHGWAQYAFRLNYIPTGATTTNSKEQTLLLPRSENIFMRGFLSDLYLRPSCHACPARSGKSSSDITLGDFWGIQHVYPKLNDNQGHNVVLIRSIKGQAFYDKMNIVNVGSDYDCLLPENPSLEYNPKHTKYARRFWREFAKKGLACISPICKQKSNLNLKAQYFKIKRALLGY